MQIPNQTIAVAYLARGADQDWLFLVERFIDSYTHNRSGINHVLYVIYKGFADTTELEKAKALFDDVKHTPIFLNDDHFDIGAYIEWANMITEDSICVFNTASEILSQDWLYKLAANLALPNVGLVGATASYESLKGFNRTFPSFPNFHIRSTAFMTDRVLFCSITAGYSIMNKIDAFQFESGRNSLTRQVLAKGKEVLLVGRNGRGYSPKFWSTSNTFRHGTQMNLLVADNQTRTFSALPWNEKREFALRTWG